MNVGNIINQIKKAKGITNQELSERTGLAISTIDKITSGINDNPKLNTLLAICDALEVTLDDLVPAKIPPHAWESTHEEDGKLSVEEVINAFVASGLFGPDEDLTDEDLRFLISIIDAIRSWFAQKEQQGR